MGEGIKVSTIVLSYLHLRNTLCDHNGEGFDMARAWMRLHVCWFFFCFLLLLLFCFVFLIGGGVDFWDFVCSLWGMFLFHLDTQLHN